MTTTLTVPAPSDPAQPLHPPNDVAAEQAVLGAMMLSGAAFAEVTELLTAEHFYLHKHTAIFDAIVAVSQAGTLSGGFADAIRVGDQLAARGELEKVGGAPYLHSCMAGMPTAANAMYYAEIVAEKAQLRRLVEAGFRVAQLGYDGAAITHHGANPAGIAQVVDRAQALIHDATLDQRTSGDGLVAAGAAAAAVLADLDNPTSRDLIISGLDPLDAIVDGLETAEFTVLCGRPGHGKTILGLNYCRHAALEQRKHTLIFSLEMSRKLLMERILSAEAGVLLNRVRGKEFCPPPDRQKLADAQSKIDSSPLYIDDATYQTTATIRSSIRRHSQRYGQPELVMIDYLSLLTPIRPGETRALELGSMSRDFKVMAGELGIPIIVIHQLNRKSTERANPLPMLSDLRDSGAIEQDAFAVIAVYSPDVDDPDLLSGESTLCVLKNRQGTTGRATVSWQGHLGRFGKIR